MGAEVTPAHQHALDGFLRSRLAVPFAWGSQDCCMFAADAVAVQTGRDPAADARRAYTTARTGAMLLQQLGGLEAVGARAGPAIGPLNAGAGDIGLVHYNDRRTLAVCMGPAWLAPGARGLVVLPLDAAERAWRVGDA